MAAARTITISCRFIAPAALAASVLWGGAVEAQVPAEGAQSLPSSTRWSVALSAPPAAPPAIADGVIIVPLQSALVLAFRLIDGNEAWRVEFATDQPPATDAERVFVASGEAVHALNAADGSVAWRAPVGKTTAPILAQQGWVIVATEGRLTALRAADGSTVWTRETGPQRERASVEGEQVYVPLVDGRVLALDVKTGETRWTRKFGGPPTEVLALQDRIYVGSTDKRFYAVDPSDGHVEWKSEVRAPVRGRPVVSGDHVLMTADNNELRAYERTHGALRWRQGLAFRPTGGPVLIDAAVLVPGTTRELRAYAAATRAEAGKVEFAQPLAVPFAVGQLEGKPVLAALTGALTEQWTLVLLEPPSPLPPTLEVETDLTGENWKAGFDSIIIR